VNYRTRRLTPRAIVASAVVAPTAKTRRTILSRTRDIDRQRAALKVFVVEHFHRLGGISRHGETLTLKIGLHAGSCIAIDSNDQIDYFGRTVNVAARVQGVARAGEIVCTREVWDAARDKATTAQHRFTVVEDAVQLKGISDAVAIVRLSGG